LKQSAILDGKRLFAFLSPLPFKGKGLRATYDVHLRLIGKRMVDVLLVLNFLLGATAEALRANID